MEKSDITNTGLILEDWTMTKRNEPRPVDGHTIEGFYSLTHNHTTISGLVMARFFLHGQELYRAWGWKEEPHCSYHLLLVEENPVPHIGCPPVEVVRGKQDTLTFTTGDASIAIPITIIS
jgi:hypothetical protein